MFLISMMAHEKHNDLVQGVSQKHDGPAHEKHDGLMTDVSQKHDDLVASRS